ncbi:MAG: diguanylate cyclase [Gammaproteobacteria bacterium]|nr:diguanylate cyclase [Gammaproteobacteria bacterium]
MHFTLYADLNCPYCYALHQYLFPFSDEISMEWRLIQHTSELNFNTFSREDSIVLINQVSDIKQQIPSLEIKTPDYKPNTEFAIQAILKNSEGDPFQRLSLIQRFYEALWVEGLDISEPEVITNIISDEARHVDNTNLNSVKKLMLQWQSSWENAEFDCNIPAIESSNKGRLIGLPTKDQLLSFLLDDDTQVIKQKDSSCVIADKFNIYVIQKEEHSKINLPKSLNNLCLLFNITYTDFKHLEPHYSNRPDCLLIDIDDTEEDCLSFIAHLKHNISLRNAPIIALSKSFTEEEKINLYDSGIAHCISLAASEKIIEHKILQQLRLKRTLDLLEACSQIDSLTELKNKHTFQHDLSIEWNRSMRAGTPLAIMLIDIDNFKAYNEFYGYNQGDITLIKISQIISSCVSRKSDAIYRWGGEEFVALLTDTDSKGVKQIAKTIQQQISEAQFPHKESDVEPFLTVSIGLACIIADDEQSQSHILNTADRALSKAKLNGKNRYELELC